MVTTARGYSYPTAREAALKLMETSYVSAQAFSGADLLHGPLALVDPQVPVLAVVADGRRRRRDGRPCCPGSPSAAPTCAASATRPRWPMRRSGFTLPDGAPEELSPLLEILPFQLLALHVAVGRGGDPDAPRGLSKITETL